MSDLAYAFSYHEDLKQEMLDGKIYSMAPPRVNHSLIAGKLHSAFLQFLKGKKCHVFFDWGYVHFSKKDKVQPDIMIICKPDIIKPTGVFGVPDLIVEILSPSTAKRDRGYKKDLYEKHGVDEYWIVDPESSTIEIYLLTDGKYLLHEVCKWVPDNQLDDLPEDDKNEIRREITPALFPDLVISMEDIFGGWMYIGDRVRSTP